MRRRILIPIALAAALAGALAVRGGDDSTPVSVSSAVPQDGPFAPRHRCKGESEILELRDDAFLSRTAPKSPAAAVEEYLSLTFPRLAPAEILRGLEVVSSTPPTRQSFGTTRLQYLVDGRAALAFGVAEYEGRYLVEYFAGCRFLTDSPTRAD